MMRSLELDPNFLLEPCDFDVAEHFVWKHHRTAKNLNKQSHLMSYLASYRTSVLGVVSLSRPCGRWGKEWGRVVEISRICFTPALTRKKFYTAPSLIVQMACNGFLAEDFYSGDQSRWGKVQNFVTYIHDTESGLYLEYAGFEKAGEVSHSPNSKGWNSREGRAESDLSDKIRYMRHVGCHYE